MYIKVFSIVILILGFGLLKMPAQTPTPITVKTISGGVLNGKALTLVKPSYPPAAKAIGASGAVSVQVTIDEAGNVISATAVSGHPLLAPACVEVAQASKFPPTMLEGQAVRLTGVIVYNFVLPVTFIEIGYELSLAENSQSIKKSQLNSINGTIPPNWTEEKEALKALDSRLKNRDEKEESPQKSPSTAINSDTPNPPRTTYSGNSTGIATRIGNAVATDESYSLDTNSVAIIKDLQSQLDTRLRVNEKVFWSFRLGRILGKLKAEIKNDEKTRANISALKELGSNIPSVISESVTVKIGEINNLFRQEMSIDERREKLAALIEDLRNLRSY